MQERVRREEVGEQLPHGKAAAAETLEACEGVGYRGWAHTPEGPTPSVRGSGRAWGLNAKGTCAPVRLCRAGAGVQFLFAGLSSSRATERSSQADARLRTRQ